MRKRIVCVMVFLVILLLAGCSERQQAPASEQDVVVQFESDGIIVKTIKNKAVETMPMLDKEGFILDGWYEDKNFNTRVFFPYRAMASCKLYAKWIDKRIGNDELAYSYNEDGTVAVTGCTSYCSTIWIPDTYEGRPVVDLKSGFLNKKQYAVLLHIGRNVSSIEENFSRCMALTAFEVDEKNNVWISEEGVLYSSDKTMLYAYPAAKEDAVFTFPEETTELGNNAFSYNLFLKEIYVNDGLNAEYTSFKKMESLEKIEVGENNNSFCSRNGVLYSKDGTSLLLFPPRYTQKIFSVAPGTIEIKEGNFSGSSITVLNINKELTSFVAPEEVSSLIEYVVEEGNAYFVSRDGVLFTDEGTVLYLVPQGKKGTYTVPSGVTEITDFSFKGSALSEINVSASVLRVGRYAFSDCKELTSVTFAAESMLEVIDESAFSRCGELIRLELTSRIPPETGSKLFDYCPGTLNVIVPAYTDGLYKAVWSFCANKIYPIGAPVTLYDVVFDSNGGSEVAGVRGAFILEEPVPSRETGNDNEYYIFIGWYDNPEGTGTKWTFPCAITEDMTLYAAWDIGFFEKNLN